MTSYEDELFKLYAKIPPMYQKHARWICVEHGGPIKDCPQDCQLIKVKDLLEPR